MNQPSGHEILQREKEARQNSFDTVQVATRDSLKYGAMGFVAAEILGVPKSFLVGLGAFAASVTIKLTKHK